MRGSDQLIVGLQHKLPEGDCLAALRMYLPTVETLLPEILGCPFAHALHYKSSGSRRYLTNVTYVRSGKSDRNWGILRAGALGMWGFLPHGYCQTQSDRRRLGTYGFLDWPHDSHMETSKIKTCVCEQQKSSSCPWIAKALCQIDTFTLHMWVEGAKRKPQKE